MGITAPLAAPLAAPQPPRGGPPADLQLPGGHSPPPGDGLAHTRQGPREATQESRAASRAGTPTGGGGPPAPPGWLAQRPAAPHSRSPSATGQEETGSPGAGRTEMRQREGDTETGRPPPAAGGSAQDGVRGGLALCHPSLRPSLPAPLGPQAAGSFPGRRPPPSLQSGGGVFKHQWRRHRGHRPHGAPHAPAHTPTTPAPRTVSTEPPPHPLQRRWGGFCPWPCPASGGSRPP